MRYTLKQIHCRPWLLNSFSLKLVESHYENNYGGAMRKLNAITEQLEKLDYASAPPFVLSGLKREQMAALNSTLLHELYFASMGDQPGTMSQSLTDALVRDFGSVDRWKKEFVAMGYALGGGSGWVVLTYVPRDGVLVNQYATDHSQSIAGGIPLLALDMYEHAYHMDFGANARAYVDSFMRNIDWKALSLRYDDAAQVPAPRPLIQEEFADVPGIGVDEVRSMLSNGAPLQLIDTRPVHSVSRQLDIAEPATWRDPDRLSEWIGQLSKSEPVVVYCAYGFHVGCRTTRALREAGYDARYMREGHSGWKAVGGPVKLTT